MIFFITFYPIELSTARPLFEISFLCLWPETGEARVRLLLLIG